MYLDGVWSQSKQYYPAIYRGSLCLPGEELKRNDFIE